MLHLLQRARSVELELCCVYEMQGTKCNHGQRTQPPHIMQARSQRLCSVWGGGLGKGSWTCVCAHECVYLWCVVCVRLCVCVCVCVRACVCAAQITLHDAAGKLRLDALQTRNKDAGDSITGRVRGRCVDPERALSMTPSLEARTASRGRRSAAGCPAGTGRGRSGRSWPGGT